MKPHVSNRRPPGKSARPAAAEPQNLAYFATAAKGTEGLLRDELRSIGIKKVRGDRGGVHFDGDLADAFRVCLHSRIAIRVLEVRGTARIRNGDDLYQFVRSLNFDDVLNPLLTLAVSASVRSSQMTHSQFVAQRVKDAVVDQQRARGARRSDVDLKHPDVRLSVHLAKDIVTLYVDLAGESLHRRGYRLQPSDAPLKETLAAALVLWSGWDRQQALLDPCCGSGTIALEAAMLAANFAPGLRRSSFGLEHHVRVDATWRERFATLRAAAESAILPERAAIVSGGDLDLSLVSAAQQAAAQIGLPLRFSRRDVLNMTPAGSNGTIVTNPPYGVRLEGGASLVRRIGESLARFAGHQLVVLSPDATWCTALGVAPNREHTLFNGDIECRAYGWSLASS